MLLRVRLAIARRRRLLGTACAMVAVVGAVAVLRPTPPPERQVLVAERDLSPLEPVTGGDLAVVSLPEEAVPDGALTPGREPNGADLTGPVRRGEVLTDARFTDSPAARYGSGMVAAPVRIADAEAVALVAPGDRVDVLAAPPADPAGFGPAAAAPARVLVSDRPVIAVPGPDRSAVGGGGGALLLLAVAPEEAGALAGHAATGTLALTIRG